jgi:23S rRNA (uracil1939-C5)-methyltransferase
MEFSFSNRSWIERLDTESGRISPSESLALGLHVRRSFEAVLNIDQCFLESSLAMEILREVRGWCRESRLPAYNTRDHQGFWRFLVIREGKRTNQILVHLLTSSQGDNGTVVERLAAHLHARFPDITTLVHSITDSKAQVATGGHSRCLLGPGSIEDQMGSLHFRISPHSFFQTNTLATEQLYNAILELGEFTGRETVWDLYCGTGSIALFIAAHVQQVVGFEVSEEAIQDAYENCALNGVDNCSFVSGDLKDVIRRVRESVPNKPSPDVVITDPPRAGMHPNVLKTLLEIAPPCIIAVSCNPATLARDLMVLLEQYHLESVQPFDLFPHTPHIECLVKLNKK